MRSIIALGTIGILLFATTSCEKEEEPPVFETRTGIRFVYHTDTYGYLLFLLRNRGSSTHPYTGDFYAPVNMPEAYKRHGLQVNVTFRQVAGNRGNYPVVEILEIEERIITERRFFVDRDMGDCGMLISTGGPFWDRSMWLTHNLPGGDNKEGLHLYLTFRTFLDGECFLDRADIIEVRNVIYTSRFYVRKMGDCGYFLVEDLGDADPRIFYPVNLPKEYQQVGLRVDVTFRRIWHWYIYDDRVKWCGEQTFNSIEVLSLMKTPEERIQTRITGGEPASIRDYPWLVMLSRGEAQELVCGGSIIAPHLILTAKHCLRGPNDMENDDPSTWKLLPPSLIQVYAGLDCWRERPLPNTFTVDEIIRHPNRNIDAVLLRLNRPIPRHLGTPINFWGSSNPALYNIGAPVRVAGWGWTKEGVPQRAECLQAVDLRVSSGASLEYPLLYHEMAATGTSPDGIRQGACHGDSGGALVARYGCNTPVHIGIISHGDSGCRGESIFVRTSYIREWLLKHVPISPPLTISGPTLVCFRDTFTITPIAPGIPVTWTHSFDLQHLGYGRFLAAHFNAQASWVQATVNNVTLRHELWTGTPFIARIHESSTHTSRIRRYTAILSTIIQYSQISRFTWYIDAPWGHARFIGNTHSHEVYVEFFNTGFFTINVTATNACGEGLQQWLSFLIFGFSGRGDGMQTYATTHIQTRPISSAFHVLFDYEEGARMHTYNVRIYDSSGNRVRQAISESESIEFDLSNLPDGTYYLHICNGIDEPVIQPIVVKNRN